MYAQAHRPSSHSRRSMNAASRLVIIMPPAKPADGRRLRIHPMQSYEVLREAAEKVGVKALAAELHLSPALIYKWCEPPDIDDPDASGARNPLDRLRDIVRLTGHVAVV